MNINIGCLPLTSGRPTFVPATNQLPLAHDPDSGTIWIHQCPNEWVPFNLDLCGLSNAEIVGIINPGTSIKVPITYNRGDGCESGSVQLDEFSLRVAEQLGLINGGPISVAAGSSNVSVVLQDVGGVDTYTISVSGQPPSRINNVQTGGNVIASHDDGSGLVQEIKETVTTLTPSESGGLDFNNELGQVVNIPPESISTLTFNAATRAHTFTSEDNTITVIPGDVVTVLQPLVGGGFNYTNEIGQVVNVPAQPAATPETITTLLPNQTIGGFDYTNEAGTVTNVPVGGSVQIVTTLTEDVNGNFTYTSEDNTTTVIPAQVVTTLQVNAGGGFDYTNEAGDVVNIPSDIVTTMEINDVTGALEYTSEDGTVTPIPSAIRSVMTNSNQATPDRLVRQIGQHADGVSLTVPINETITTLVPNEDDGGLDFKNEAGDVVNIPTSSASAAGGGIDITNGVISATSGASSTVVPQVTQTNVQTATNVGPPVIYNRVNPLKKVMVLITCGSEILYDPQVAGLGSTSVDLKGQFVVFADINSAPREVTVNQFDKSVVTLTNSNGDAFFNRNDGTHQEIVDSDTITIQMSLGNLTVISGNVAVASTTGGIWGISPQGVTITFLEV